MNLVTSTTIPDQNYLVGDPKLDLLAYVYTFVPSNAVLNVVYSLVNPPSFVSIATTTGTWISI